MATEKEIKAIQFGVSGDVYKLPDVSSKQDKLTSGVNIKTINNESVLGSGNIDIQKVVAPTVSNNTIIFASGNGITVQNKELIFSF